MSKEHNHHPKSLKQPSKRLLVVLLMTASYLVLEVVGGLLSNSLALLADAGHMLTDVAALGISWLAFKISKRPPNKKATYGYHRVEVLAALFNGLTLLVVACFIVKEAFTRLMEPKAIMTGAMIAIGAGGLLVNLVGLYLLREDKAQNINIKGAWLHLLFDALGSVMVVVSGLLIRFFDLQAADSIGSIGIAVLVFYSSANLVAETISVLMEQTPPHIDRDSVIGELVALAGVLSVHDLHIWSITPGKEAMSAHVIVHTTVDYDRLQTEIHETLFHKFGIEHATIQMERGCTRPDATCEPSTAQSPLE